MVYAGAIHRGVDDPRRGVEVLFRRCRSDAIESRQTQAAPVGHPVNYPPPHCAHTILQKEKKKSLSQNPPAGRPHPIKVGSSRIPQGSHKDPREFEANQSTKRLQLFNKQTNPSGIIHNPWIDP